MAEEQTVCFGPYVFEPQQARLRRARRVLPLTYKACEVLQHLVEHPGQLVTKEALFQAVWPETAVSDTALTNRIAELREALGDDAKRPRYIATVHRQGYRFVARSGLGRPPPHSPPAETPRADRGLAHGPACSASPGGARGRTRPPTPAVHGGPARAAAAWCS